MQTKLNRSKQRDYNDGFTIIELMIAITIFSLVLLVIMAAITQIGKMYYKGVTAARTQNTTRQIVDRISQEIQFSDMAIEPRNVYSANQKVGVLCLGKTRFFYTLNKMHGVESNYGVWVDDGSTGSITDPCAQSPNSVATLEGMQSQIPTNALNGSEMLHERARLLDLQIAKTGGSWTVKVRVATGEADMFESVSPDGQLIAFNDRPELAVCKGSEVGTQFCSVSELTSTVTKRL